YSFTRDGPAGKLHNMVGVPFRRKFSTFPPSTLAEASRWGAVDEESHEREPGGGITGVEALEVWDTSYSCARVIPGHPKRRQAH
ncbi:MAG: hypothetical protein ACR2PK_13915, partial [Acidimicrobiales bacterium]